MAIFVALWKGWVIPGSTLTTLIKQWDQRLREAHERERDWKKAHDRQQEVAATAVDQTEALLESFDVLEKYIRAVPAAAKVLEAEHE